MAKEPTEMLVEAVTLEVPDAKTIRLQWPAGYQADFKTGQFVTCTRLAPGDPWPGRRGRTTPEWVCEQVSDPAQSVFYACGPNALVELAEDIVVRQLRVPRARMRTEKWG